MCVVDSSWTTLIKAGAVAVAAVSRRRSSIAAHTAAFSVDDYRGNWSSGGRFTGMARRTVRAVTRLVESY